MSGGGGATGSKKSHKAQHRGATQNKSTDPARYLLNPTTPPLPHLATVSIIFNCVFGCFSAREIHTKKLPPKKSCRKLFATKYKIKGGTKKIQQFDVGLFLDLFVIFRVFLGLKKKEALGCPLTCSIPGRLRFDLSCRGNQIIKLRASPAI
jgi:hypothetical protein